MTVVVKRIHQINEYWWFDWTFVTMSLQSRAVIWLIMNSHSENAICAFISYFKRLTSIKLMISECDAVEFSLHKEAWANQI